jgi:hypothetical protein
MILSLRMNIKMIFTSIIICLLSINTFSQKTRLDVVLSSVNTNFNYGNSNGVLKSYKKKVSGVQFGASFQGWLTPWFSIVPELYFTMKGGTLKANNPITINESTIRLYEGEIPLLARFHFGKFYINSGPYLAYTFTGRIKIEGSPAIPEKSTKISFDDSRDAFKRWEMGAQAGTGYVFHHQESRIAVDLRYSYGLTNISQDLDRYNRGLNLSVRITKSEK